MNLKISIIVALTIIAANATEVRECKSQPFPENVRIKDCESPPCILKRGFNTELQIDFLVPKNSDSLKAKVWATVLGISIPYQLPDDNACNGLLNGYCPVDSGELLTYNLIMPVLSSYPKVNLDLEFSIRDDDKDTVACFKIQCQVK